MAYCSYCGTLLEAGARFCSACGAPVTQETAAPVVAAPVSAVNGSVYTGTGYAVMLVDLGTCPSAAAADLISDTCGYTDAEAVQLAASAPTWVAENLTRQQAVYLAQTLTEYGMEASVFDSSGNQTVTSDVDTVFDSSGSLIAKVTSALGLIGLGNRITRTIRRLTLPRRPVVYQPPRPVSRPPVRRQSFRMVHVPHQPTPQPVQQPVHQPRPAAQPARPVQPRQPRQTARPQTAARPQSAARPASGGRSPAQGAHKPGQGGHGGPGGSGGPHHRP